MCDVALVDFGGQDPRLVGHLVVVVGLEGAAEERGSEVKEVLPVEKCLQSTCPRVHPAMMATPRCYWWS